MELLYLAQFRIQRLHYRRHIQLKQSGVSADKAPDIDWSGEDLEVPLLECPQVVPTNFSNLSNLLNGEALGLASLAKLFGNRRHSSVYKKVWRLSRRG